MISVDQAFATLLAHRPARTLTDLPLTETPGLQLAANVTALTSRPPTDVSAMDGYAVRLADVANAGARLCVIGEAPAGAPFAGTVGRGEAVRIFTGSVMPNGTDHIVIQEDADRDGVTLICKERYDLARHVRSMGRDFRAGETVLQAGERISPAHIAIAASANHATLKVWAPSRVAMLSNGDELKPPGSALKTGEITNSNPFALGAMITGWGGQASTLGIAGDTEAAIRAHIDAASDDTDIFLPIGGASVGDHDHMRAAFLNAGFEMVFEKIAVKPGKPTWFARRGDQRVLGLPGNPASALVCAHLFLKPLIFACDGLDIACAQLAADLPSGGRRETFLRAHARINAAGQVEVEPYADQDSSLMTPFLNANCLIRRNEDAPAMSTGETVSVIRIGPI